MAGGEGGLSRFRMRPGGVCLTTNLAAIYYVRKSTLYLSICKNTLPQSKQFCHPKVCHGTYQSLEEPLPF